LEVAEQADEQVQFLVVDLQEAPGRSGKSRVLVCRLTAREAELGVEEWDKAQLTASAVITAVEVAAEVSQLRSARAAMA
jgi:hypothetical protein